MRKNNELRFGLSYQGGKAQHWRLLVPLIPRCSTFYDIFAGGCAVGHMVMHFGRCERAVFSDISPSGPGLFDMAMRGELPPPRWVSRAEFKELPVTEPIRLLFTFKCKLDSYFCGKKLEPWARELFHLRTTGDFSFFASQPEMDGCPPELTRRWTREHIERANALAGRMAGEAPGRYDAATLCRSTPAERYERLTFFSRYNRKPYSITIGDYRAAAETAGEGDVIYADPPYAGTAGYLEKFDNVEFWDWARRPRKAVLLISEYAAPPDFIEVGRRNVTCRMATGMASPRIEKVFVHRGQAGLYAEMMGAPPLPLNFS